MISKSLLFFYLYPLVLFTQFNLSTYNLTVLFWDLFRGYSLVQEGVSVVFMFQDAV